MSGGPSIPKDFDRVAFLVDYVPREELEQTKRLLEMAREEIVWLREQLPGTPVVGDHIDGDGRA